MIQSLLLNDGFRFEFLQIRLCYGGLCEVRIWLSWDWDLELICCCIMKTENGICIVVCWWWFIVFFDVHHFFDFFYDLIRKMAREKGFRVCNWWLYQSLGHINHFHSKMVLEYNSQKPFLSSSSNCVSPKLNDGNGSRSLVFFTC